MAKMQSNRTNTKESITLTSAIWQLADVLRGELKSSEFQDVILPLIFMIRLDVSSCGSEIHSNPRDQEARLSFKQLCEAFESDQGREKANALLTRFLNGLGPEVQHLFETIEAGRMFKRLGDAGLLGAVFSLAARLYLPVADLDHVATGDLYEELQRRFAEIEGEAAGEHYTPSELVDLMSDLLCLGSGFKKSSAKNLTLYDPACGTGGMLVKASERIRQNLPKSEIASSGQELNPRTHALAELIRMTSAGEGYRFLLGNTLVDDRFHNQTFALMIANPPFGVDWKKTEIQIRAEASSLTEKNRFSAGLPRVSDGSLLFLQHLISKMRDPKDGGSRIAIVFSGSPLFAGLPESGESKIRQWILANDLLEGVIALPDAIFQNTTIGTYVWILSNNKSKSMRQKIRLVDARQRFTRLARNIGCRRNEISKSQIFEIISDYESGIDSRTSRTISTVDCCRIVVPFVMEIEPGDAESDAISVPWPKAVDIPAVSLDSPNAIWIMDHVKAYCDSEISPNVHTYRLNLNKAKVSCEIPIMRFFAVQKATALPRSDMGELLDLVEKLKQGERKQDAT